MNETEIFNELLRQGGKKQVEIAESEKVVKQYVQKWKNGRTKPSLTRLHRIADFLGLQILIKIQKKEQTQKNYRTVKTPHEIQLRHS